MKWSVDYKHKVKVGRFTIEYNTAKELGIAAAEIKMIFNESIKNPYDPSSIDFNDFNNAMRETRFKS